MENSILILNLPSSHQAFFSALNCEKMLPSIKKFDENEAESAVSLFEKSIAAVYSFSLGSSIKLTEFDALKEDVESFWPDLDESENYFASYAFDAFIAMTEALNFVLSGDSVHVTNCAAAVMDTVDMYIQETNETEPPAAELVAFIQANPFMKREVKRQATFLNELAKTSVIDARAVAHLKSMNEQEILVDFTAL